jgi:putative ABC transport system permease protein
VSPYLFKTAVKNVVSKTNTSIFSLVGLTIAFISILYIFSYVSFELGYDSQHENADRIYRISGEIVASENTMTHAKLGPLMGPGLKDEYPEVETFTRLTPFQQDVFLENNGEKFNVEEAYMVDHSVFDIFSLEFVFGNKEKALVAPDQIVINQRLSQKIFGAVNPVGKTLKHNNKVLTIIGVIKDSKANAHHKLNVLFSQAAFNSTDLNAIIQSEWYWTPSTYTFILLKPACDISTITENFEPFFTKYMATFGQVLNADFNPIATPLKDLHFSKHMSYDNFKGNKSYTTILIFVAIFIFLIALINYSNLIVFQSITNSKNIELKKIFGATKFSIFLQFLTNSLLFVTVSILIAWFVFKLTLPFSESITGLTPEEFYNANRIMLLAVFMVFITAFSSSLIPFMNQYGKQVLSQLNSKNTNQIKIKGLRFNKSTTIVQFSLSIVLIISSITITKQLYFLVNQDMGFDKNNVVLVNLPKEQTTLSKATAFKDELESSPLILNTAISSHAPGEILGSINFQLDRDGKTVTKIVNSMQIDYNYIPLMGMEFRGGRNFNPEYKTDLKQSIIINEAFVDYCGFTEDIVNTRINNVKVIGVLKNASFNSLHTQTEPVLFLLNDESKGYVNVKLKTSNIEEAISFIKNSWISFFPELPFEYHFLDQRIEMLYENDQKKNTLMQLFTLVSIIISSMGFLILASNISKQKTKEIGIRKVNGASSSEIVIMLNKNFVKWITLAFVIACPIAYYAMNRWLQNFAYKIALSWWIFALSGFIALLIALITISWQTFKAAGQNPVESLRSE